MKYTDCEVNKKWIIKKMRKLHPMMYFENISFGPQLDSKKIGTVFLVIIFIKLNNSLLDCNLRQ
jgi:hypothetical protein